MILVSKSFDLKSIFMIMPRCIAFVQIIKCFSNRDISLQILECHNHISVRVEFRWKYFDFKATISALGVFYYKFEMQEL